MQNREERKGVSLQGVMISVFFGGIIALAVCCLLLLIFSFMVVAGTVPERSMPSVSIVVCGICSMIGARFAVLRRGANPPMIVAIMTGIVMALLIILIGYMGYEKPTLQGSSLWILLSVLIGGIVAGLSKSSKKTKRKKRRKR